MKNPILKYPIKLNVALICLVLMGLSSNTVWSQPGNPLFGLYGYMRVEIDMQSIAIIDIETTGSSSNFTFTLPLPSTAGGDLGSNPLSSNSENWINYSSANRDITSRRVDVNITSGTVPGGLELHLDIASSSGVGGGTLGTPAVSTLTLSSSVQTAIDGIQGAFTGDGANNGHQLTYSLHAISEDFESLDGDSANNTLTITYTLTDN